MCFVLHLDAPVAGTGGVVGGIVEDHLERFEIAGRSELFDVIVLHDQEDGWLRSYHRHTLPELVRCGDRSSQ